MSISYFEEIGILDRPFVNLTAAVNGKDVKLRARALSAMEKDELEALQLDAYGRELSRLTVAEPGSVSELERVSAVYAAKPKSDIVAQLLSARDSEIQARALEYSGIDLRSELEHIKSIENEDEREEYARVQNERFEDAKKAAKESIRLELEANSEHDLVREIAQINVNIRAQNAATKLYHSHVVYYALYRPDKDEKCFTSAADVTSSWTESTIRRLAETIQRSLETDIPFVSEAAPARKKRRSSQSTSEPATEVGGKPTKTTKGG